MNRSLPLKSGVVLSALLWASLTGSVKAADRVRAKLGVQIQSAGQVSAAKTTAQVKVGDVLRVYVVPEDDAYIYVVRNDGVHVTLLNWATAHTKVPKGAATVFPTRDTSYSLAGISAAETLTIICSPQELSTVARLSQTPPLPAGQWRALEKELMTKSQIELGQKTEKPLQIAGSVRGINSDLFLEGLPVYSGHSMLVKKYAFRVQK